MWGRVVYHTSDNVALCFYGLRLGWLQIGALKLRRVPAPAGYLSPERYHTLLRAP